MNKQYYYFTYYKHNKYEIYYSFEQDNCEIVNVNQLTILSCEDKHIKERNELGLLHEVSEAVFNMAKEAVATILDLRSF